MHACEFGSVDVVELLLNYGADATTQISKYFFTCRTSINGHLPTANTYMYSAKC